MEIVLGFFGIVIAIVIIFYFMDSIEEMIWKVNWGTFLKYFIFGGVGLAIIFSFTAEGVLVVVGFYFILLIGALVVGKFNNKNN